MGFRITPAGANFLAILRVRFMLTTAGSTPTAAPRGSVFAR